MGRRPGEARRRHRDDIANIRGRFRRSFFEVHAILIGLARKLAPARRLILGAALICFVLPAFGPFEFSHAGKHTTIRFELCGVSSLVLGFILLLVLVAMELVDKIEFRDELVLARELQASLIPIEPSFVFRDSSWPPTTGSRTWSAEISTTSSPSRTDRSRFSSATPRATE